MEQLPLRRVAAAVLAGRYKNCPGSGVPPPYTNRRGLVADLNRHAASRRPPGGCWAGRAKESSLASTALSLIASHRQFSRKVIAWRRRSRMQIMVKQADGILGNRTRPQPAARNRQGIAMRRLLDRIHAMALDYNDCQNQLKSRGWEVANLRSEAVTLQREVATWQYQAATLQDEITGLRGEIGTLHTQMAEIVDSRVSVPASVSQDSIVARAPGQSARASRRGCFSASDPLYPAQRTVSLWRSIIGAMAPLRPQLAQPAPQTYLKR